MLFSFLSSNLIIYLAFCNLSINTVDFKSTLLQNTGNSIKSQILVTESQNDTIYNYVAEDNDRELNYYLNNGGSSDKYFHTAVTVGAIKCARIMIEHGANVNSVDVNNDKLTPLMVAAKHTYRVRYEMNELLVKNGADVNARASRGSTPIMFASWGTAKHYEDEYVKVVKLFIQNGAKMNAKNDSGKTALSIAQSGKWHKIVAVLKKARAKT
jgi:uncharacterized protein